MAEEMCHYYEQVAEQLYVVSEKVKRCINLGVRRNNFSNPDETIKKIEETAERKLGEKMNIYQKITDIEKMILKNGNDMNPYDNCPKHNKNQFPSINNDSFLNNFSAPDPFKHPFPPK